MVTKLERSWKTQLTKTIQPVITTDRLTRETVGIHCHDHNVRTLYAFVIKDAGDSIVDGVERRSVQTLHSGRHQSQHALSGPAHVLVTVPLDCAFHLVTLATTRSLSTQQSSHVPEAICSICSTPVSLTVTTTNRLPHSACLQLNVHVLHLSRDL